MRSLISTTFTMLALSVSGQKIVAELTALSDTKIQDVTLVPAGDSILFSYKQLVGQNRIGPAVWISPDGTTRTMTNYAEYFRVVTREDTTYYYFFDGKGALCAYLEQGSSFKRSTQQVELQGEILGIWQEDGLNFIYSEKKSDKLGVININGLRIAGQREFDIPKKFRDPIKKASNVEFIASDMPINSFKGIEKSAIYKQGEYLYLTYDESVYGSKTNKVKVWKIGLDTGSSDYSEIAIPAPAELKSFLFDGKLFVFLPQKRRAQLEVYDLEGKKLASSVTSVDEIEDFHIYFRHGADLVVSHSETFSRTLKLTSTTTPALTIFSEAGVPVIQAGSYFDEKGASAPFITSANPLAGMFTWVAFTAIRQALSQRPGVSRHFNYESDGESGYKINPNAENIRQRIDDYEMEIARTTKKKPKTYDCKEYCSYGNGILAVYKFKREKTVQLVYFE